MSGISSSSASAPAPDSLLCSLNSCGSGKGFEVYQAVIFLSPILCIVVLTLSFCFCYLRRRSLLLQRYTPPPAFRVYMSAAPGDGGLPVALLNSFPTMPFVDIEMADPGKESQETQCPVCLAEYGPSDVLRKLPCHAFHVDCIDAWLAQHCTCPICRMVLTPAGEVVPGQDLEMIDIELRDNEHIQPSGGLEARGTAP